MAAAHHLQEVTRKTVEGRAKLGVSAFAEALLGIPKILAENSGFDAQVWAGLFWRLMPVALLPAAGDTPVVLWKQYWTWQTQPAFGTHMHACMHACGRCAP